MDAVAPRQTAEQKKISSYVIVASVCLLGLTMYQNGYEKGLLDGRAQEKEGDE